MLDVRELGECLKRSYQDLKKVRDLRDQYIAAAAGTLYPHTQRDGAVVDDILPLMRQAAEAYAVSLVANNPQVLITARNPQQIADAMHVENALNTFSKINHMGSTLATCAQNSFYGLGWAKVFMADSVPVELEYDQWADPGKTFVGAGSPQHLVYDTDATDFRYCSYISDRYKVSFDKVVSEPRFSKDLRAKIERAGPQSPSSAVREEWGRPLGYHSDKRYKPYLFLADVFLLEDSEIYTFVVNEQFELVIEEPLDGKRWRGHETGPYHFLNTGPIPEKTTVSPPAQHGFRMHNLLNSSYRKLMEQADRQKSLKLFTTGAEDDAEKVRTAPDGSLVPVMDPQNIVEQRFDGPDQNLLAYTLNGLDLFNRYMGNPAMILGTSPSSKTVGQEKIIAENVDSASAHRQTVFTNFVVGIFEEVKRLLFDDVTTEFDMPLRVPGTRYAVADKWRRATEPNARNGKSSDYDLCINPYSLPYKSPQDELAEVDQQFQMLIPLTPLLMQTGKMPNVDEWLRQRARLLNNPALENLLVSVLPPDQAGSSGGHERTLNAQTGPHEYIHRSESSGSQDQGFDPLAMMQAANASNN